jgi:hypothetical protein
MNQMNGQSLSREELKEMLEAVQIHLINEFGIKPEVVDLLTPVEVVAMFESKGTYPLMYQQLGEKLNQRYYEETRHETPAPWLANDEGEEVNGG